MAISYVYSGQPMNGTDQDDFVIAFKGSTTTDNNTIFGNGGDDWVMADSSDTWIPGASYLNGSIADAFNLEALTGTWTTGENPMFGDYTIPHTTVIAETTIGQSELYKVAIGAGQQITIDIDFASNTPIGNPRDLVVELQDSLGNIIVTADDSLVTDGGVGSAPATPTSASSYDPYVVYTVATGGTYYINVRPFGGGPGSTFTENNTFVMNVSVTGHVTGTTPVQGNDIIDGGDGDDFLMGAGGADTIQGGQGNDTIHGGSGVDTINGGIGNDVLYGGDATEESVHGNDGSDILHSGGEGHYYGDAGNDLVYAGVTSGVNELLDGGADTDTLDTTTWTGAYIINLETGTTNFGESFTNFENVVTGNGDDTITGTAVRNIITTKGGTDTIAAGDGNDVIDSGAGNDSLDGGVGADVMKGGLGDDTYFVDAAGDVASEATNEGLDTVMSGVSYTLGANVENLTLTGTAANGTGNGLVNTLIGNGSNNVLDGKAGADTLQGGTGNDTYRVDNAGDIVLEAAAGGSDRVLASVSYSLTAGQQIEALWTADAAATTALHLTGNELANTLIGNAGDNVLDGLGGVDTMRGGLGDDTYVVDAAGDVVSELSGQGTDTVEASITKTLGGTVENLTLTGVGNINGTGNGLANTLLGNTGNNTLDGKAGADTMKGGAGDDTYVVDAASDVVTELPGEGTDTVKSSISYTLGNNIENLTLTGAANINGTGNGLANTLLGNTGNNAVDGMAGADTMKGGSGDDVYIVDNAGDIVTELAGQGTDTVKAGVTYTIASNVEKLTLTGTGNINGTGNGLANTLLGNTGDNTLDGKADADTMKGGAGDDTYVVDNAGDVVTELAGQGADTVEAAITCTLANNVENLTLTGAGSTNGTGNGLANTLLGNAGNNILDGGAGNDTMKGGAGSDTYVVANAGDIVTELAGQGIDTVQASISYTLTNNVEKLLLTGAGNISGTGNGLANTLTGNGGGNTLDGKAGADTMEGGTGNDTYVVDNAGDVVTELAGQGTDTVEAIVSYTLDDNIEKLTLAGAGNTSGTGNGLANQVVGNAGNNLIAGKLGSDLLAGGSGQDSFLFDTTLNGLSNVDTIADFDAPNDTMRLDKSIFTAFATTGTLAAGAFQLGTTALEADDRILYDTASGDVFYDRDGTGAAAAVKFAHLNGSPVLTHSDFLIVA